MPLSSCRATACVARAPLAPPCTFSHAMLLPSVLAATGALWASTHYKESQRKPLPGAATTFNPTYDTKWFSAWVDNFNPWGPTSGATYQQRYLINDTFWGGNDDDCIAFYTGECRR